MKRSSSSLAKPGKVAVQTGRESVSWAASVLRPAPHRFALEPRQMFDAAAAADMFQAADAPAARADAPREASAAEAPLLPVAPAVEAAAASPRASEGKAVYVIDAAVRDAAVLEGAIPDGATVLHLAPGVSGMSQLATALASMGDVGALHLISHGAQGQFTLGGDTLDVATLDAFQSQWNAVAAALRPGADILLYGCRIAADGGLLVEQLARMTGADVAASIDDTGAAAGGGDWVLEAGAGEVTATVLSVEGYGWMLAAPNLAGPAGVVAVGENTGGTVGGGITVGGTGADMLRATASVTAGKGALAFGGPPAGVTIVSGSGSNSLVFEGTAADLQAALSVLNYSYVGTSETGDSDTLSLSVTNQTTGGTATLAGGRAITVQPQNDVPTVVPPAFPAGANLLTLDEGGGVNFVAATPASGLGANQVNLGLVDADNTTRQVIIKITALPSLGTLTLNGREVAAGQTLPASDIANLRYVHGGGQVLAVTQDSFRINVDDGAGGLVAGVDVPIRLNPVNDPPAAGGTITLIEGETGVPLSGGSVPAPVGGSRGSLTITDPDQAAGVPFTVDITSLPARGVLRYNGALVSAGQTIANFDASRLSYSHDGSETTSDSFTIRVTDDGGGAGAASRLTSPDQTISLSIIPNNDDPTLPVNTGVVLGNGQALAGPSVTLTRAMLQAADVDSPDDRLTYTLTGLPTNGYLVSTDFPGTFLPLGFTFKQSELDAGKIRFIATSTGPFVTDFDFTLTDSSVRLWPAPQREGGLYANETTTTLEQRSFRIESTGLPAGGGGAAQPGAAAPVNAVPVVGGTLLLGPDRVAEGQTIVLTAAELGATDADNAASQLVYRIDTLPQNGQLLLGATSLILAGSFTQADVDAGRISYRHDGGEMFGGSFQFTLSDGERAVGPRVFTFDVLPQNDTPTATGASLKVAEGGSIATSLGVGDGDNATPTDRTADYAQDNTLTLEVVTLPDPLTGQLRLDGAPVVAGALLATADLARVTYHHLGAERYTDSFQVRPLDDRGVAAAGTPAGNPTNQPSLGGTITVNITVLPVNDPPVFAGKREGVLREGESITIQGATGYTGDLAGVTGSGTPALPATGAFLSYSDSDNATDQRQYRVTTAPANGAVRLNGQVLGAGSVFTQADLDAGRITYVHDGSETTADFFDYVVSDGDWRANETTSFPQGAATTPGRFNFAISGTNDAPAVAGPSGPINIDSTVAANNPVAGFVVSDIDLTDGVGPTEVDFVQVTLRLLDSTGAPITNYATGFAGGGVSLAIAAGSGATVTRSGPDDIVQFQGSRAQVNAALAGLTVTFANDCDLVYRLQVIVDDRVRNGAGVLDASGSDANGGELNQGRPAGSAATAVPNTVFDWATAVAVPADHPNIIARTVDLRASHTNDLATFTAPVAATVDEDVRTRVSGSFAVSDPESDAFGTPVVVTLSVPAGNGGTLGVGAAAASTSLAPAGGQAVTISGDNTRSITLTGRAMDIQALLNGRNLANTADDATGGLFYTTVLNVNHDLNGADAGDVTLAGTFSDSTSGIGGDVGAGSVANNPPDVATALTITAVNDAPVVSLPGAALVVEGTAAVTVTGVSLTDVDANDGYATGETDGTVQVLVRLLAAGGVPLDATAYASAGTGLGVTIESTAVGHGATVDGVLNGSGAPVEVRGTLAQVQAWLAGLQVTFANLANSNVDQAYSIEAVADDRLRDLGTGALATNANGGATNQQVGLPAVPATDTFDAYATTVSAYNVYNVVRATRSVFVSSINDPGSISANNVTVAEASATLVLNAGNANITIADPDDNGATNLTATVTLPAGSALVFSEVGGSGGSVLGTGTAQLTLTGTEAELNVRLKALTVAFPDPVGAARAVDWNGSFTVTVVYNDAGKTGTRPAGIPGDTNVPTANPGDFDYASPGPSAALVTTRTFTVTVTAVNDAPLLPTFFAIPPILPVVEEDAPGGVGSNPPGATVLDLFGPAYTDPRDQVNQAVTAGSVADAFAGIAITGNAAIGAQGVWQYSTDGSNWTALPVVSETSALQLQPGDRLRFVPTADFHGTPGVLTARLVDASGPALVTGSTVDVFDAFSGGSTRYSDSSNTVTHTVTVLPVNDRPTAASTALAATFEDNTNPTGAALAALGFGYGDAIDNRTSIAGGGNTATALGGYAIVGNVANATGEGRWQFSTGGAWTDVGAVSDASAVVLPTTASLRFLPAADFNGTPGALTLRLADSVQAVATGANLSGSVGPTGTWSLPVTLATSVDPRNDAPVLSGTVSATFTEGSPAAALLSGATAADIDLPGAVTFGGGRITVSLDTWRAGDVLSIAGSPAGVVGTSGGSGASLVLQLNTAATPATIGTILNALRFENTSNDPVGHLLGIDDFDRAYTVVLNDGNNVNGAANAGGNGGGDPTLNSNVLAGVITVVTVNDPPVATDDTSTLTEDTASVSGNVKTGVGGTLDTDPDHLNAELFVSGIRAGAVEGAGAAGAVGGGALAGLYGTLSIAAGGSYTYTLDRAHPVVNALVNGQSLVESFNYTISDPVGAQDAAVLAITITGVTDGGPSISAVDGNGAAAGQATVYESGLTLDGPAGQSRTASGELAVSAPDGLATVGIGGTVFTVAQLASYSVLSPSAAIVTAAGSLRVTGFVVVSGADAAPASARVLFSYTLDAAQLQPGATESLDTLALQVTDASSAAASGVGALGVAIVDDLPEARADTAAVVAGTTAAALQTAGNVVVAGAAGDASDRIGADTVAAPVTALSAGGLAGTPGTALSGRYGQLQMAASGAYVYRADATNPAVAVLGPGRTLVDVFDYTITDADGDTSTTTLSITLRGDAVPLPASGADRPVEGERRDPFRPFDMRRSVNAPMEPSLHVQNAVRETAAGTLEHGRLIQGLALPPGSEIHSDSLSIPDSMDPTEHVSRDGVRYSRQLLADGQERPGSLGNVYVVGNQTLFDPFSPFGTREVVAAGAEAAVLAAQDGAPPVAERPPQPGEGTGAPAVAQDGTGAARAVPLAPWTGFTQQLRQVALDRALVREGQSSPMLPRVVHAPAAATTAATEGARTLARAG